MKYHLPRPIFGYFLVSLVGAGILAGISLVAYDIDGIDVPDEKRMYLLLWGFCISILFFVLRAFLKRNRRDYVSLEIGYIEWVRFEKRKVVTEKIDVKEMRLIEVTYFEGSEQPSFYSVYGATDDQWGQLEIYSIPLQSILAYAQQHSIPILNSTIRYHDIESVSANTKRIRIKYFPKSQFFAWGRSKKISFLNIAGIQFVTTHPISKREDYYVITTKEGKIYKFSSMDVNEAALSEAAIQNGIQIAR